MFDFNARHVIEALRSGVPSRAVGEYFSEARPAMLKKIRSRLDDVRETGCSSPKVTAMAASTAAQTHKSV